jgi:alpha-beta hydrolase superfamily lysophospholipase
LALDVAVLVVHACESGGGSTWNSAYACTDTVLDVRAIARLSAGVGSMVRRVGLQDAMHDVLLSRQPVRDRAYREMLDFAAPREASPA